MCPGHVPTYLRSGSRSSLYTGTSTRLITSFTTSVSTGTSTRWVRTTSRTTSTGIGTSRTTSRTTSCGTTTSFTTSTSFSTTISRGCNPATIARNVAISRSCTCCSLSRASSRRRISSMYAS